MITAANRLQIVSRHGVGFDNVPIAACTERRIPVTIVGAVNTVAVAEHTIFLLLAAARAGVELDVAVRRGDFSIRGRTAAVELSGRTLLVIGLGRIVLSPHAAALTGDALGAMSVATVRNVFDAFTAPSTRHWSSTRRCSCVRPETDIQVARVSSSAVRITRHDGWP